jgi:hypothetical protein
MQFVGQNFERERHRERERVLKASILVGKCEALDCELRMTTSPYS